MKIIIYLLIGSIVLFAFTAGFVFISTVIELNTLGIRARNSLVAAGWAGFKAIDLERLAERHDMADAEDRDIYLDNATATNEVMQYIKKNLKLDSTLYAKQDSYITDRSRPVVISDITVYNPDDLPVECSRGTSLDRTTIHIVIQIPVYIHFLGYKYLEKHVDVDVKSFFKE